MKNRSIVKPQIKIAILTLLLVLSLSIVIWGFDGSMQNVIPASAETATPFTFVKTSDDECSVRLLDKTVTLAIIPNVAVINGKEYTVTSIAANGFASASKLEKVRLPKTVKTIGQGAFTNCKALKSLTLPAVESIGANAFAMTGMEYIVIPATVKNVAPTILRNTSTKVYVRASLAEGSSFPDGVWASNWNGYNSNQNVEYSSDFVPEIEYRDVSMTQATSLLGMTLYADTNPSEEVCIVEGFQEFVTMETDDYTEVYIPAVHNGKRVAGIANSAFYWNDIQKLTIGYSDEPINIAGDAFNCLTSNSVTINRDVILTDTSWETGEIITSENVFANAQIETLILPDTITAFGRGMFNSSRISNISFISPQPMSQTEEMAIKDGLALSSVVVLPQALLSIGAESFSGLDGITELHIPSSVVDVENNIVVDWGNLGYPQTVYVNYPNKQATVNAGWDVEWDGGCNVDAIEYTVNIVYNITYVLNVDAVHNNPTEFTRKNEIALSEAVKTGYSFIGWYLTPDYTGQPVIKIEKGTEGDLTLYGKMTNNYYTVTYNSNIPDEASDRNVYGETKDSSHVYDKANTLSSNSFQVTGWHFVCWKDVAGTEYANGQTVINLTSENNGVVELFAVWERNLFSVVYLDNRPAQATLLGAMEDSEHNYDTDTYLSKNEFFALGWTFVGWNTDKDGRGTSYEDSQYIGTLNVNHNYKYYLYAQWMPNIYYIHYNANRPNNASHLPEGSMSDSRHVYGDVSIRLGNGFKIMGWNFMEWNTKEDGSGHSFDENSEALNVLKKCVTKDDNGKTFNLYAQWRQSEILVNYKAVKPQSASGNLVVKDTQLEYTFDGEGYVEQNMHQLEGWHFTYWAAESNGGGKYFYAGSSVQTLLESYLEADASITSIDLYAQFSPNYYKIEFRNNLLSKDWNGGNMFSRTCNYDTSYTIDNCNYISYCYKFEYWTTENNGGTRYYAGNRFDNLTSNNGGIIILYAQWTEKTFDECLASDGYYYIGTNTQFDGLRTNAGNANYKFKLLNNFEFINWKSIDNNYAKIDGNGYTIAYSTNNLLWGSNSAGLVINNYGIIENLIVVPFIQHTKRVDNSAVSVGGIAARNQAGGIVRDCTVKSYLQLYKGNSTPSYSSSVKNVDILSDNNYCRTGGIVGYNFGTISGCVNFASIGGRSNLGGITGENYGSSASITDCENYGNIYYEHDSKLIHGVGGVVGYLKHGKLDGCSNYGVVNYSVKSVVEGTTFTGMAQVVGLKGSNATVLSVFCNGTVLKANNVYLSATQSNYFFAGAIGGTYDA